MTTLLNRFNLLLALISFLLCSACQKEDHLSTACQLSKRSYAIDDTEFFKYDSRGRITQVDYMVSGYPGRYVVKYNTRNQLINTKFTGHDLILSRTYEYDNQNRWVKSSLYQEFSEEESVLLDITKADYDRTGNRIRVVTSIDTLHYEETYVYSNGNLVKYTNPSALNPVIVTYEYYLDKENPLRNVEGQLRLIKFKNDWLEGMATPNQNLLKRVTSSTGVNIELSYEFNARGLPIKRTCTTRNTRDIDYQYNCP